MGNKPIVHAPIATGSTEPRDIRDRFADFVNLKDFGAAGDGATDDSAAWAAWRTALQSGGMPYIPAGDYLLGEETIHVPKGHLGRNTNSFTYEDDGVVIDELNSSVYVDATNGDDDNDGFTSTTAVQTLVKAVSIIDSLPRTNHQHCVIEVAAGTYTGDLYFKDGVRCTINVRGNITINGTLDIIWHSCVYIISDNNSTVSINTSTDSPISAHNYSALMCSVDISLTTSNSSAAVNVYRYSYVQIQGNLTITCNGSTNAIRVNNVCQLYCYGLVTINGTITTTCVYIVNYSYLCSVAGIITNAAVSGTGLYAGDHSFAYLTTANNTYSNNKTITIRGANVCDSFSNSRIQIADVTTLNLIRSGNGDVVKARRLSLFYIDPTCTTCNITLGNFSGNCFNCYDISEAAIGGTALKINGTCGNVASTNFYSILSFSSSSDMSITGTVTGRRYNVGIASTIYVRGAGANRLPGNTAGTVNSAQGLYL